MPLPEKLPLESDTALDGFWSGYNPFWPLPELEKTSQVLGLAGGPKGLFVLSTESLLFGSMYAGAWPLYISSS